MFGRLRHACILFGWILAVLPVSPGDSYAHDRLSVDARCSRAPSVTHLPRHPIVAFGDSITWGIAATINCMPGVVVPVDPVRDHVPGPNDTTYPGDLSRVVRRPVLNYGLPGEQTVSGLPRLAQVLKSVRPSTVLILEGVNDLYAGYAPSSVVNRLSAMATAARRAGALPVLLTLTRTYFPAASGEAWINPRVDSTNRAVRHLARQRRIPLVDLYRAFPAPAKEAQVMLQPNGGQDYLHPNDAGYKLMARAVAAVLRRLPNL